MKHILIVDDEEIARESLKQILTLEGYSVLVAENGLRALAILAQGEISLMILDLKMDGMSGMDVLERIQEISPFTKVIIATAHASVETAVQALRYRVFEYLIKPFDPAELVDSVRQTLKPNNVIMEGKLQKSIAFDEKNGIYFLQKGIKVDIKRREIADGRVVISLTPAEAKMMESLLDRYGNVVSHIELVKEIQGYSISRIEAAKIIRPLMCRLRIKLKQFEGVEDWVVNIRGAGYLFEVK
jgi:DNA-binding response OmpR family regulator